MTIPYFSFTSFNVGPLPIQVWGIFVALGIVLSFYILYRILNGKFFQPAFSENERNRQWELVSNLFFAVVLFGFIGARLVHVFLYQWSYYREHLIEIIAVWHGGLSSFGGFLGAAVALAYFYKKHKQVSWKKIYDACALAFPWGWFVGRLGCFMIHDHPSGPCPGCLLGIQYKDGTVRADLGLYDGLLALFIGVILVIGHKKRWFKKEGSIAVALILLYSIPRFFLDFLRAFPGDVAFGDTRYLGLTPAQYLSVMFVVIAFAMMKNKKSINSQNK